MDHSVVIPFCCQLTQVVPDKIQEGRKQMCVDLLAPCYTGMLTLKSYRTATTLCVPDLVFNDISRHKILLPEGTPVQREILTGMLFVIE